jgi:hypothetical protein
MPTRSNRKRKLEPAPAAGGGQGDLAEEIAALRGMLHQAGQLSENDLPPGLRMRLLDIYSRAAGRLASLLKMQQALAGHQGAGDALSTILDEVIADIAKNQERFPDP